MDFPFFRKTLQTGTDPETQEEYQYYQILTTEVPQQLGIAIPPEYVRIATIHLPSDYDQDPDFLGRDYADQLGMSSLDQGSDWAKDLMMVNIVDDMAPDGEQNVRMTYRQWEPIASTYPDPVKFTYPSGMMGEVLEPPPQEAPTPMVAQEHNLKESWFFGVVPTGQHYRIAQQNIPREAVQVVSSEGLVDVVRIDTQIMEDPENAAQDERFLGRDYYDTVGRGYGGLTADPNTWKWVLGVQYQDGENITTARYDSWEDMSPQPAPVRFVYFQE